MKKILIACTVVMLAFIGGALCYVAYTNAYAYSQVSLQLKRLQTRTASAPVWKYGTIESIDGGSNTIVMRFSTGTALKIKIPANAFIGYQELESENGVFTAAKDPIPGVFSNLRVGDKAAVVLIKTDPTEFSASLIVVGNPL